MADTRMALPISVPLAMSAAGWPRPRAPWRGGLFQDRGRCPELPDLLPVPWINGTEVEARGDWHGFRDNALGIMQRGRLCLICGLPVEGPIFLPAQGDPEDRATSGGGGHARCTLLAVKRCPHIVSRDYENDDVIGWRWDGPGLGLLLPRDDECHGDRDSVDPGAAEITLAELKVEARNA